MKRMWISLALLVLVFAAAIGNTFYLERLCGQLSSLLTQAETRGEAEDWEKALELTRQAEALWDRHDMYLHVTLRHTDTDDVFLSFKEVKEFLQCQEEGEYSAANAVLLGQIHLLCEQEQFNLKNLF